MDADTRRATFPRSRRLARDAQYKAVYGAKMKKTAGPLIGYSKPNELPHYRLGLSVGKRVGNAVDRNTVKRMIREAFRLVQHELPRGENAYDLIVSARENSGLTLERYREALSELAAALHKEWERRGRRCG